MKAFFDAIETLFVDYLFWPYDTLRHLEPHTWWGANIMSWIFIAICAYAFVYWCKQLKLQEDRGEENHDVTAHSFME